MSDDIDISKLDISDEMIAERRSGDPGHLPDDMAPWMRRTIALIDTVSLWSGKIFCWLLVPLMVAMVYEVVARKLFTAPTMWAYDISRMTSGAMFMLGAGYALMRGVHIRADFLYRTWPVRFQGVVDAILYVILYFPGIIFFFYISTEFATEAWVRGERSMDTAWMAPVGPVRSAMALGAFLLILQGISELLKSVYAVRHDRWP